MKSIIITLTFLAAILSSQAAIVYSTDFNTQNVAGETTETQWTEADSVSDSSNWNGDYRVQTFDVDGSGYARNTNGSNRRITLAQGSTMAKGETWTFNISLASTEGKLNRYDAAMGLGLTATAGADPELGVNLWAELDNQWSINDVANTAANANEYDSGVTVGINTFSDVTLTITKSLAENEFDLVATIAGGMGSGFSTTVTDAALYNDATVLYASFLFSEDDKVNSSVSSLSVIPEPAVIGMVGLGAFALLVARRRFA